jgi:hypothetical protein
MKTISKVLVIILFFSFTESVIAQKKTPAEILGFKVLKVKTIKGKSNEYRITVYDNDYFINNKKSVYEKVKPNYSIGDFEYMPIATLSDGDLVKLQQFTGDLIGNYVVKTPKTWQFGDNINIRMFSDMQGNIKDVEFGIPTGISIPIEVIEQLETFVKKEMKLHFKINHTNQNANYMVHSYGIEFEPMRKAREMKVK